MPRCRPIFATLAIIAALASGSSSAAEYKQFQADRSTLTFVTRQMGVPIDGSFRKFTASIAFDPAKPTAASARIVLDLASIDAGSKDANDEVVGKPWFNIKVFPSATFVSSAVRPLGGDRYEVAGKLTIKDRTQDLAAPFSFRQEGSVGVFDGNFVVKRLDFGVGDGAWSDVGTVANEVQIRFHIVAAPATTRR